MKIRLIALCAITGLCACLHAAEPSDAPLAIYYSFDSAPPATLFTEMQSELTRILAPAHLQVTWRSIDNELATGESFREIVVLRFRGACLFEQGNPVRPDDPDPVGLPLAETELVDGHILPFGEVQCDQLRRFIAPVAGNLKVERGNAALGRAMARVGAHEIYHMLTGSMAHARSGIARAEHSRAELMASTFAFAKPEEEWLRSWVVKQTPEKAVTAELPAPVNVAVLENGPPASASTTAEFVTADSR